MSFENPEFGIKIKYPATWEKEEKQNVIEFFSPLTSSSDNIPHIIEIQTENLDENNLSLDGYIESSLKEIREANSDFRRIDYSRTILAGLPAQKIVFSFTSNDRESPTTFGHIIQCMAICTIKEKRAYVFVYYAEPAKYASSVALIQKIIDSFEIIE